MKQITFHFRIKINEKDLSLTREINREGDLTIHLDDGISNLDLLKRHGYFTRILRKKADL